MTAPALKGDTYFQASSQLPGPGGSYGITGVIHPDVPRVTRDPFLLNVL